MARKYRPPQSGHCVKCRCWRKHLHRDHIVPKWKGGSDTPDNWQWLCANCHEDKTYEERATPEYKTMQSALFKARATPEFRKKISEAVKAANAKRQWTPEMRARCARPGVKRIFTAEHLKNLRAAAKTRRYKED